MANFYLLFISLLLLVLPCLSFGQGHLCDTNAVFQTVLSGSVQDAYHSSVEVPGEGYLFAGSRDQGNFDFDLCVDHCHGIPDFWSKLQRIDTQQLLD